MTDWIPLARPDIGPDEIAAVNAVLHSDRLTLGSMLETFENRMADYIGQPYAVGVNSGTAGLFLSLKALGIGVGDEVITVSFSYVATGHAIVQSGATPVFVDIDADTFNINPGEIESAITTKTRAILVVHVFGRPAAMDTIMAIAKRFDLAVIEDACEAIGAKFKDKQIGSYGDLAVFGFSPNKQITLAEGGMVVTSDRQIAERIRHLRNQDSEIISGKYTFFEPGYSFRLSELHAALGITQLERIEEILARRQKIASTYKSHLQHPSPWTLPGKGVANDNISWFAYVIRIKNNRGSKNRDQIIACMAEHKIECGVYFPPIHLQPLFVERYGYLSGMLPVTEKVATQVIALPFFHQITMNEIKRVIDALINATANYGILVS